jgi:uncharacterized protein YjiS (DUF1127 family)
MFNIFTNVCKYIKDTISLNREIDQLCSFSDRELNDIGISRSDIGMIARGYNLRKGYY